MAQKYAVLTDPEGKQYDICLKHRPEGFSWSFKIVYCIYSYQGKLCIVKFINYLKINSRHCFFAWVTSHKDQCWWQTHFLPKLLVQNVSTKHHWEQKNYTKSTHFITLPIEISSSSYLNWWLNKLQFRSWEKLGNFFCFNEVSSWIF